MKLSFDSPISAVNKISKDHAEGLKRLGIVTLKDLLYHFPTRYADMRELGSVGTIAPGNQVTIYGVMEKVAVRRSFKGHIPMTEARVADNSGAIRCIWFNQAYIGKMYPDGTKVKISGTVQEDKRGLFLSNPHIERTETITPESQDSLFAKGADTEFLTPVYRETKGVSSLYLYTLVKRAVSGGVLETVTDPIPKHVLSKLHLPELNDALLYIHFPKHENLTIAARKRFAFEEIFYMQIKQYREKLEAQHFLAHPVSVEKEMLGKFIDRFSFSPTKAQISAIESILHDMERSLPMGRLLEGDVGSGKTFVAATVAYATLLNQASGTKQQLQVAYMAPTEILARQHFESFITFFGGTSIEIGLLTGSGCRKFPSKTNGEASTDVSRTQLLKWIADGRMSIVIGTHALIQKSDRKSVV